MPRSTVETKVRGAARYLGPLSALCLSIFCYAATKCVSMHCLTSHPMQTVLCENYKYKVGVEAHLTSSL